MVSQRFFLIASSCALLLIVWAAIRPFGLASAQTSGGNGTDQASMPDPSATPTHEPQATEASTGLQQRAATPELTLTTAGWVDLTLLSPASEVTAMALAPVDCNVMTSPVVGYEISKGQNPDEIANFANDLVANGFSIGTVDISGNTLPPACVDVLIVQGSLQAGALPASYTAAEGALLRGWANSGHGLMISGEFDVYRLPIQELFLAFGYSQLGPGPVIDPTNSESPAPPPAGSWVIYQTANFAGHPILNGVNSLEFLASSWLSPTTNAIVAADTVDAVPPGAAVMAAFVEGAGCVALSTDSNWYVTLPVGDGYSKEDNARVARQMIEWLNTCARLNLTKLADPSLVQAGQVLTYTLTTVNNSGIPVTNVIITDTVPVSTSFVSATTPHAGPDANGVVTWSLGALGLNASAMVTMTVQIETTVPTGTLIANTALVNSTEGLTDTATTVTPVDNPLVNPLITKAVDPTQAQVGDVVTFTLTVQQPGGNINATNVQITDLLPSQLDILNVQASLGLTRMLGQQVTWSIPILTPVGRAAITIRTRVNNTISAPATLTNQAVLSYDQGPDRPSNLVQLAVIVLPSPTPTPPTPTPPSSTPPSAPAGGNTGNDDDDDDNNDNVKPAPSPTIPAPAPTVALPVAFLPDTGSRADTGSDGWALVGMVLLGVVGGILKFKWSRKAD